MTIGLVKTGGWGLNERLTSNQQTTLDQHASWALDRRSGYSDTCASTIAATSAWTFSNVVTFTGTGALATAIADANFTGAVTFVGGNTTFGQATGSNAVVTFNGNSGSPEVVVFGAQSAVTFACTAGAVDFTGTAVNFGGTSGAPTAVTFGPYAPCTFQGAGFTLLAVSFGNLTLVSFAGTVSFNSGFAVAGSTTSTFNGSTVFLGAASYGTGNTVTFNGPAVFANTGTVSFNGVTTLAGTNLFTTALQPSGTGGIYQLRSPQDLPMSGPFTPSDSDTWIVPVGLGSTPITITCSTPTMPCRFSIKQRDGTSQTTTLTIAFSGSGGVTFNKITTGVYSALQQGSVFMEWDGTRFRLLSLFGGDDPAHTGSNAVAIS
jgi:hypothetical protein